MYNLTRAAERQTKKTREAYCCTARFRMTTDHENDNNSDSQAAVKRLVPLIRVNLQSLVDRGTHLRIYTDIA